VYICRWLQSRINVIITVHCHAPTPTLNSTIRQQDSCDQQTDAWQRFERYWVCWLFTRSLRQGRYHATSTYREGKYSIFRKQVRRPCNIVRPPVRSNGRSYKMLVMFFLFTARCTIVQSAVLRSHVVRLSVRLSVCNVGGLWSHRLGNLETNCTDN